MLSIDWKYKGYRNGYWIHNLKYKDKPKSHSTGHSAPSVGHLYLSIHKDH